MVRMWEKLQASQLIEEFGRREPEALSHAPCPETGKLKALFAEPPTRYGVDLDGTPAEIAAQSQLNKWQEDIQAVAHDETFTGFTPATEQQLHAEVQLTRVLFTTGEWHQVDNAWQVGLLPEAHVVRRLSDASVGLVVRCYATAALLWPAKQVELDLWQVDLAVEELTWVVCFKIEHFEVIPCTWASPLHLILQVAINKNVHAI